MRIQYSLLALMVVSSPLAGAAQDITSLAQHLLGLDDYRGDTRFEVLLPQAQDPVTYDITLQSRKPERPDSLAPCDYVIRWSTLAPSGELTGFSAYFDGNHYRYRNEKLQEYHFEANPDVFMPRGAGSQLRFGVQCQAQFADQLPQFLGARLMEIATDTQYVYTFHPDTLVSGKRSIVVDGVKRSGGYDVQEYTYVFDHSTLMPVMIDMVTGPGSISEQLIDVYYSPASEDGAVEYSEEGLIEEWPDVFERYRQSNFRAESLVGNPLPSFTSPTLEASDRYAHQRGEALGAPTIFAVLDVDVSSTAATIEAVRQAVATLPMTVKVVWVFNTNRADEVKALIDPLEPGESVLVSASTMIRNCGITLFPTIIFANAQGVVKDVVCGFNNDLDSIVIQKSMLLD